LQENVSLTINFSDQMLLVNVVNVIFFVVNN